MSTTAWDHFVTSALVVGGTLAALIAILLAVELTGRIRGGDR